VWQRIERDGSFGRVAFCDFQVCACGWMDQAGESINGVFEIVPTGIIFWQPSMPSGCASYT
jgi:hypothetical protein